MESPTARLIEPTQALRDEFLDMAREYSQSGDERYASALDDFGVYLPASGQWYWAGPSSRARDWGSTFMTAYEFPRCTTKKFVILCQPDESAADFENTVGHLTGERRRWLKGALKKLYGCHEWESRL
jgi:hypothetical protein